MTTIEIYALEELAENFRLRAEAFKAMTEQHEDTAAHLVRRGPMHQKILRDAERVKGRAAAYANAAADLKRFLHAVTAETTPPAEPAAGKE